MKSGRKIFSFFFLLIFLVSNTGLPLSLHLCQMMNEVSVDACEMCSTQKEEKSCCSDDTAAEEITSVKTSCCETIIAAEPIKDSYISAKEYSDSKAVDLVILNEISILSDETDKFHYNEINASPPYYQNQVLYIINSSFLI
jgi:hypothetical protein